MGEGLLRPLHASLPRQIVLHFFQKNINVFFSVNFLPAVV